MLSTDRCSPFARGPDRRQCVGRQTVACSRPSLVAGQRSQVADVGGKKMPETVAQACRDGTGGGGDRGRAGDRPGDRRRAGRARVLGRRQLPIRCRRGPADVCREAEARGARQALALQADVADLDEAPAAGPDARPASAASTSGSTMPGSLRAVRADLLETTPESWDRVLGTNLRGPFFLTQAVAEPCSIEAAGLVTRAPDRLHHLDLEHVRQRQSSANIASSKAGLSMVAQLFAVRLAGHGSASTRSGPA